MGKKVFVISAILFLALGLASAQAADAFKAGGWEFGAMFSLVDSQDYPVLSPDVADSDKDTFLIIDCAATAGLFIKDNFSLVLKPSVFFMNNVNKNMDGTKDTNPMLDLGLAVAPTCYIPLASNLALGLGGSLGMNFWPGLDYLNSDVKQTNKSLMISCVLEPEASLVVFLAGNMALTVQGGYAFTFMKEVKNSSGDAVTLPSGYSIFDDITGKLSLSLGLRYFLPEGGRLGQTSERSFADFIGIIGK